MPSYEDDVPRLAEIARTLADFRSEFRSSIEGMVRRDVYASDRQALDLQIRAVEQENRRLAEQLTTDRNDRRGLRNIAIGAIVVALAGPVLTAVAQAVISG